MNALDHIVEYKLEEVEVAKSKRPLIDICKAVDDLPPSRGFANQLNFVEESGQNALICEFKRKSPSAGNINIGADCKTISLEYERGGAACMSILTDNPSFGGSLDDIGSIRETISLPLLRKDFLVDPYQVYESRAGGADAILVIMAITKDPLALEFVEIARSIGLDVLVEVHNEQELERALKLPNELLGINNRDLKKMQTDLTTTENLSPLVPSHLQIVAESGIKNAADIHRLRRVGVRRFLIGESLMVSGDRVDNIRKLKFETGVL